MEGYIKIHRSIWDWEWCDDAQTVLLWLYLLSMANYEDKRWHGIVIKRGQLVVSLDSIKEKIGLSHRQIRTRLDRLISAEQIVKQTTNKFTLLTICNYDKYQCNEFAERQTNDNPSTNERQTNDNDIRKIRNKEINNQPTNARTCACEEWTLERKLEKLREVYVDERWVHDMAELSLMPEGDVKKAIEDMARELKLADTDDSENEIELLKHLKAYIRNAKRLNNKNNGTIDNKRRGTLAIATSAKEYSTTF